MPKRDRRCVRAAVVDRLLLLLEQILEDELTPSAAARVHQRATLVKLSQLDGCEPELIGQIRHGRDRVLVIARQKDDTMAPFDDWVGSQNGCNQVIETFHELRAGERLRDEGGGHEAAQLFRENSKRVRRVDDGLAFPAGQRLRHIAMSPNGPAKMMVLASSASCSDFATTVGPIARACGANASGGRRLATVTSMFLRAKAWARAWPILPNPIIA